MTELTPLYDPRNGQMRVIGFMSRSGTNLRKILEYQKLFERTDGSSPYAVVAIFTDTYGIKCKADEIANDYGLQIIRRDLSGFFAARGLKRKNLKKLKDALDANPGNTQLLEEYKQQLKIRTEFDMANIRLLGPCGASVAAFAGYMAIATPPLVRAFLGVNVHPADLSLVDAEGKRKYIGDHAVIDAILAGEKELRASTHRIEEEVDTGRIFMVSAPLPVVLPPDWNPEDKALVQKVADEHQDRLKEIGDWVIFPRTLEDIARGRFAQDENCLLYYDGEPVHNGLRLP